jgi:ADP-heptose:LPS heptosyltransferase
VILILRALGLGDLLTAVPALRALARAHPGEERVLAMPAALAPLALRTGAVDRVAPAEPLGPLDPSLWGARLAVNLHGKGPQSTAVLAATRPRALWAFETPGGPRWRVDEHERSRWCRMVAWYGVSADSGDLRIDAPTADDDGVAEDLVRTAAGATLVHPGAASPARRWPPDRWVQVARALTEAGEHVLVTGSASERPLAGAVAAGAGLPAERVLAGRTDVLTLAAVVAGARRILCGDTGVAHLATAFGTPSVVLFGPTAPAHWGPPPGPHVSLWAGRPGDPHGATPDPGLLEIGVGDVLRALGRADRAP